MVGNCHILIYSILIKIFNIRIMMFIQRILCENLKEKSVFDFLLFMTKHLKRQTLGRIFPPALEVGFIWVIGQSRGLQG